jgi:hypothetical protein
LFLIALTLPEFFFCSGEKRKHTGYQGESPRGRESKVPGTKGSVVNPEICGKASKL